MARGGEEGARPGYVCKCVFLLALGHVARVAEGPAKRVKAATINGPQKLESRRNRRERQNCFPTKTTGRNRFQSGRKDRNRGLRRESSAMAKLLRWTRSPPPEVLRRSTTALFPSLKAIAIRFSQSECGRHQRIGATHRIQSFLPGTWAGIH